jgi:cysteine desulfurase
MDPAGGQGEPGAAAAKILNFDANATTAMSREAIAAMVRWCNRGNASAEYASAREARRMLDAFRREIADECGFDLEGPDAYAVIFTSGASESNAAIVTGAVRAYAAKTNRLPHVVTSAAEHRSLLLCCRRLAAERLCQLTELPVGQAGPGLGAVAPADLAAALRPNTCLVSVMAANNETGVLNDVRALAAAAHRAGVPFHTDAAQLFGKAAVRPRALGADAFSASFHKLHGPPGVGLLVVRRAFLEGYGLPPLVAGTQNGGQRGGTENVPGLAAAFIAFRETMADRAAKTARVRRHRDALKAAVAARLPCFPLDAHPAADPVSLDGGITPPPPRRHEGTAEGRRALAASDAQGTPVVFWLAPPDERRVLPNTLLLAVRRPGFCNRAARAALERRGVIVSLGAACSAADPAPSGTVAAMGVHEALRGGVLRVSLCDSTTAEEVEAFVERFVAVVTSGECLAAAPSWRPPASAPGPPLGMPTPRAGPRRATEHRRARPPHRGAPRRRKTGGQ